MLDVDRRDRPVEGGGEERLAVVVGGVQEHVALEAEVTVPARHEFAGEPLHAHVALRGGFGLLRGSLGVAHIHLQAGQESPGGVDGRQQEVLVAPAVWAADGSGQSQQEREGDAQHGRARGSSGLMMVSLLARYSVAVAEQFVVYLLHQFRVCAVLLPLRARRVK